MAVSKSNHVYLVNRDFSKNLSLAVSLSPDFGYDQLSTVDVEPVSTGGEVVLSSTLFVRGILVDKLIHNKQRPAIRQ